MKHKPYSTTAGAKRRLAWAAAVCLFAASTARAAPVLTLGAAIDQALNANPGQTIRRLDVDKSNEGVEAARGARWPQVDINAGATRFGYPTFVTPIREIGVFPPLDSTIYNAGLALRLPLYAGGRLRRNVQLAQLGKRISAERARLGSQQLIYNVSAVYFKILHLEALEQVYTARISSLTAQQKQVKLFVQVGKAARLDLLRVNVVLDKAKHDRLQIHNLREEAVTLLNNLLGRETSASVQPQLVQYTTGAKPAWSLKTLRRNALENRPELKIARDQARSGAVSEKIARGERLPTISLVGSYAEHAGDNQLYYDDWNIGVQLSVPLTDGGVRRHRQAQARIERQQAQEKLRQARLDLTKDLQDSWNTMDEAASRLKVTAAGITEAREALHIEQLKYEQGVGVMTDLLNAQSELLTAQADRLQARFDLMIARLDMLRVAGELRPAAVVKLVRPIDNQKEQEATQ